MMRYLMTNYTNKYIKFWKKVYLMYGDSPVHYNTLVKFEEYRIDNGISYEKWAIQNNIVKIFGFGKNGVLEEVPLDKYLNTAAYNFIIDARIMNEMEDDDKKTQ